MVAEVAVFGFTLKPSNYSYLVPHGVAVSPGQLVEVPFGKKTREGVVVSLSEKTNLKIRLKEISEVKSLAPILTPNQIELAHWIAKRYFISTAYAIHLMLPHVPENLVKDHFSITKGIKQELLLFPTLRQAEMAQKNYPGLIFSHQNKADFEKNWIAIASGRVQTILGTRSALFAPYRSLSKITIFQSESDLYKEERRPYYRSFDVALALAQISGAPISAVSFSPRVQDQYRLPHQIKKAPHPQEVKIIDLKGQETVNGALIEKVKNSKGRALIFLNRKSEKGPLFCQTCKVRSYTSNTSACPNCGSSQVRFQLLNLQTVAEKLSKLRTNLTFSTQQIFFQDTPLFDQVVVISADTYLNQANFQSSEKTFQMLVGLQRLIKPGGKMVVQTAHPEESAIRLALSGSYEAFYQEELAKRREVGYPPFSQIAKVIYAKKEHLPELGLPSELEVFGPFEDSKRSYYIVRGQNLDELSDLKYPWKLDIDPASL